MHASSIKKMHVAVYKYEITVSQFHLKLLYFFVVDISKTVYVFESLICSVTISILYYSFTLLLLLTILLLLPLFWIY